MRFPFQRTHRLTEKQGALFEGVGRAEVLGDNQEQQEEERPFNEIGMERSVNVGSQCIVTIFQTSLLCRCCRVL
jgi:hypothetical protein